MATVNLGNIKFNWKGTYNAGTAYAIDDVVSYNGSSYVCIAATTGNLPTVTAKWDVMSSAGTNGTNGTDVGTTITTQGDLLYRDGSGLQRLAAGTSGHFLKTQGSGANPVWAESGGTHVKLAEINQTSAVGSVAMQQFITSTYKYYKVILNNVVHSAASNQTEVRMLTGTNTQYQSNNYYGAGNGYYKQYAGGSGSSHDQFSTMGVNYFRFTPGFNPGDDWGSMYIMDLYVEAGKNPMMVANSITPRHSNQYLYQGTSAMVINDTSTTFTGLLMYPNSGANITNANILIYGIKQ